MISDVVYGPKTSTEEEEEEEDVTEDNIAPQEIEGVEEDFIPDLGDKQQEGFEEEEEEEETVPCKLIFLYLNGVMMNSHFPKSHFFQYCKIFDCSCHVCDHLKTKFTASVKHIC